MQGRRWLSGRVPRPVHKVPVGALSHHLLGCPAIMEGALTRCSSGSPWERIHPSALEVPIVADGRGSDWSATGGVVIGWALLEG
jgi:hypothetical protein